jgi:3-methyladenine DNA glycosylase AlkD
MVRLCMSANPIDVTALSATVRRRIARLRPANTPHLRTLRRELSKQLAEAPPSAILGIAEDLLGPGVSGQRFIAYELVCHHPATLAGLGEKELLRLGRGLDSWAAVDTFACYLSGPVWRERQVSDGLIRRWARSRDRWWRRAALVSTVPLNNCARGGHGDVARTLPVCAMLMQDRDDMVVKALSWALRELAKRDPAAVRTFLDAHKEKLAPRVLREVHHKLATGLKNPRRKLDRKL